MVDTKISGLTAGTPGTADTIPFQRGGTNNYKSTPQAMELSAIYGQVVGTPLATDTIPFQRGGTAVWQSTFSDSIAGKIYEGSGAVLTAGTIADGEYLVRSGNTLIGGTPGGGEPFEGFLVNGKISVTVASNNLTVAVKTLAGSDPSAGDPVQVRLNNTIMDITSALSVTKNAGTNWCNSGSAELATQEVDYFVYLGYNATDGITIGFARFPGARIYSDFSATSTNEKYCAISTITNAAASDSYCVIGRFAATLSAGAGYTWSVPTFTNLNLVQSPVYTTRLLTFVPTLTRLSGYTSAQYKIINGDLFSMISAQNKTVTGAGSVVVSLPFAPALSATFPTSLAYNAAYITSYTQLDVSTKSYYIYKDGTAGAFAGTETGFSLAVDLRYSI
jgi:hypothetical protein